MDKINELTNDIIVKMLEDKTRERNNLKNMVIVMASIMLMQTLLLGGGILYVLNNYEATTTTTTTTEQQIEGDSAEINNVDGNQYKDNATHHQGGDK